MAWRRRQSESRRGGFTLVELLIVIVVIAILAAITIVSFNGITNRAKASALQSTLQQAATKLEIYKVDNGTYPPDQATVASLVNFDSSTALAYAANGAANPPAFCLVAAQGSQQFSVGSGSPAPSANACVVNLAVDPRATINGSPTGTLGWKPLWYGTGGAGTVSLITGAVDGPISGLTTYIRKTWTTAPVGGSGNTGFQHSFTATSGSSTAGMGVTVGTAYTFSSYLRSSKTFSGSWTIYIRWHDAAGAVVGTGMIGGTPVAALAAGVWTRVSLTAVAPPGAAVVEVASDCGGSPAGTWAAGDTLDGTGLLVTQGSTLYSYADGNSPGWSWTGTPNASTSFGPPL